MQISSIVLMFGMIAGVLGFCSREESAGDTTCNIENWTPMLHGVSFVDATKHFKRLNGGPIHRFGLIQPKLDR